MKKHNDQRQQTMGHQVSAMALMVAILTFASVSFADHPDFYGSLEFGPHAVGFKTVMVFDRSRPFATTEGGPLPGRPLQISMWYPAEGKGRPMQYKDYVSELAKVVPVGAGTWEESLARFEQTLQTLGRKYDQTTLDSIMTTPVRATRAATKTKGPLPMVLTGTMHPYANPGICEYLASHGFLVVNTPSLGPQSWTFQVNAQQIDAGLRDKEFCMAYMLEHEDVDPDRMGMIAFSFNSISSLLAAMRHDRFKAIVSIEGWEGLERGKSFFEDAIHFKRNDFHAALFHVAASPNAPDKNFAMLESFRYSDRFLLGIENFRHEDALSMGLLFKDDLTEDRLSKYELVARYTLSFLKAHLRGEQASMVLLKKAPVNLGPVGKEVSIRFMPAGQAPPKSAQLLAWLEDDATYERTLAAIREAFHREPGAKIMDESIINSTGYRLLAAKKMEEALELFRWNAEIHPESANVWDSLAEGYLIKGDKKNALKYYQKTLDLNANNPNAKRIVITLEAEAAAQQ